MKSSIKHLFASGKALPPLHHWSVLCCGTWLLLHLTACGPINPLDDPKNWIQIDEPRFGFSAIFPRKFNHDEIKVVPQETENGVVINHIFAQSSLAFYYSVSCAKFPGASVMESHPGDTLKKAIDDIVNTYHAEVLQEYQITRNRFPGRYVKANIPKEKMGLNNNNRLHSMAFLRGSYLYRVTAVGLGNEPQVALFFDSFQLKPL